MAGLRLTATAALRRKGLLFLDNSRFLPLFRSRSNRDARRTPLHRSGTLAPGLALFVVLLLAGPALSAVRVGTSGNDTLIGTKRNDQITGNAGNDTLIGNAGNDTYFFADNWGTDTLVEKAGGGRDTVDFHAVTTAGVIVNLIPEWVDVLSDANTGTGPGGTVRFAFEANGEVVQSIVENAIGSQGDGDIIIAGGGNTVLQPGGGATDGLVDISGYDDGPGGNPEIPVSNEVYKGFATNTGTDFVQDFGGNGDVLDLRPFSTGDVFATAIDFDHDADGTLESLQIVTGLTGQIIIFGQFGDVADTAVHNAHCHIETIRFANKTFSTADAARSMATASTESTSGKQARLAAAAAGLAEEARGLIDPNDLLGVFTESRGERKRR
jgi:hypothetical protein